MKWAAFNRLEDIHLDTCKNAEEFASKARNIKAEINDLNININDAITLKVLNFLGTSYSQFLVVVNNDARQESKLYNIDSFLKNLINEEAHILNEGKATSNYIQKKKEKKKEKNDKPENLRINLLPSQHHTVRHRQNGIKIG